MASRHKQNAKAGARAPADYLISNRRNAAKSTGPQSAEGKRNASLNAMRHGLTSQSSIEARHPSIEAITDLICIEIGDHAASQQIACKIVEFERTLHAQHQVALAYVRGENGLRDAEQASRLTAEAMLATEVFKVGEQNRKNKKLLSHQREEMKLFVEAGRFLQRLAVRRTQALDREAIAQAVALRRYFKRSSNQLIKAIRRLSEPLAMLD